MIVGHVQQVFFYWFCANLKNFHIFTQNLSNMGIIIENSRKHTLFFSKYFRSTWNILKIFQVEPEIKNTAPYPTPEPAKRLRNRAPLGQTPWILPQTLQATGLPHGMPWTGLGGSGQTFFLGFFLGFLGFWGLKNSRVFFYAFFARCCLVYFLTENSEKF